MRQLLRGVVGLVVVVGLAAAGVAFYYFNYSPDRTTYSLRGIDVWHHQGSDRLGQGGEVGCGMILKATEGGDYVDETFARNLAGAEAAGLVVGHITSPLFTRRSRQQIS